MRSDAKTFSHVSLRGVSKSYGSHRILREIGLDIARGEFVVLVGPSGCGKSTLLKTIAGLESVSSGRILIAGRDVTDADPGDRGIAMVFQSYALYPHMTVAENMGFGLKMAKRPRAEIEKAVGMAADILKLNDQLGKLPRQLSGGQRQRVAIGRAITRSPEVFLFDEPLSNLDASLRTQMRVELSTLHARLGSTMIYVTHDQVEAMTMATRIVVLNAGRIEQVGTPLELYHNPRNMFVAGFIGAPRMNFFRAIVEAVDAKMVVLRAPGLTETLSLPVHDATALRAGQAVSIGVRPDAIGFARDGARGVDFAGEVRIVERLGRETIVYADASPFVTTASESGSGFFSLQSDETDGISAGRPVRLSFSEKDAYLFCEDGNTLSPARASLF